MIFAGNERAKLIDVRGRYDVQGCFDVQGRYHVQGRFDVQGYDDAVRHEVLQCLRGFEPIIFALLFLAILLLLFRYIKEVSSISPKLM